MVYVLVRHAKESAAPMSGLQEKRDLTYGEELFCILRRSQALSFGSIITIQATIANPVSTTAMLMANQNQLSGGNKKRIAIPIAIVTTAAIEPAPRTRPTIRTKETLITPAMKYGYRVRYKMNCGTADAIAMPSNP